MKHNPAEKQAHQGDGLPIVQLGELYLASSRIASNTYCWPDRLELGSIIS